MKKEGALRKNFHKPKQETTLASVALEKKGWVSAPRKHMKKVCVYIHKYV